MAKAHVNGADTCDVFRWLRTHSELYNKSTDEANLILWNYGKFLVNGTTGEVVKYLGPQQEPKDFETEIRALLGL